MTEAKRPTGDAKEKFLTLARRRLTRAIDADKHNRKQAIEDLKFLNGEQWDPQQLTDRKADNRPALMINLLPQFVSQVTGDARHNRPQVKVSGVDSKSDPHVATIREGIIRDIEYQSNGDLVYDQAQDMQVECGYGAWRILTRYTEENPFMQEIYLEAVRNPFMVHMDPDAKDPCFADAKYGFILRKMSKEDFEEEFPEAVPPPDRLSTDTGGTYEHWYDKNLITVAEYFFIEYQKKTMCQMKDGSVIEEDKVAEAVQKWEEERAQAVIGAAMEGSIRAQLTPPGESTPGAITPQGQAPDMPQTSSAAASPMPPPTTPKPEVARRRDTHVPKVKHYIITGWDILDGPDDVPGTFIPIVLEQGKERNIEGKRYVRGLIRDAKDAQRAVNYWETATAEMIALAPKAPWLGTAKMFEGYEEDYRQANQKNFPFLKFNVDPDVPDQRPSRNHPGDPPVALFTQRLSAHENLKKTIGLHNVDVGDQGREITGAAIVAKQRPGDIGTFAFIDNHARAIRHSARIINSMIPEVYDTERDVRIRRVDNTETFVPVNTTAGDAMKSISANPQRYAGMDKNKLQQSIKRHGSETKFNDITTGKYGVVVTVGPSYATQRQESAEMLLRLYQADPKRMGLALDMIVKNMDFKDAEALAYRLKRTLPPGMVPQVPGEPPMPPMPPSPAMLLQNLKMEVEKEKLAVNKARHKTEQIKALKEMREARGETRQMLLELLKEVFEAEPGAAGAPQPQ